MSIFTGPDYRSYKTAKDLLAAYPSLAGKDNYYTLYPQGPTSQYQLIWCDMTTDGGGWMLLLHGRSIQPSTVSDRSRTKF
jgi:hypothetical protein